MCIIRRIQWWLIDRIVAKTARMFEDFEAER